MENQNKNKNKMLHGKHVCNYMGQEIVTDPNNRDLYAKGVFSENNIVHKKSGYKMIMPYDIFMKNEYNM